MTIRQEAVEGLLAKFPDASSAALGRMLYKENKKLFTSKDAAYQAIRTARGSHGNRKRKLATHEPTQFTADGFGSLPEGKTHFDSEWGSVQIDGKCNALILADAHIPYHNRKSLLSSIDYGRRNGADLVILNGDTLDAFAVSFWEKDPRKRDFSGELKTIREFLGCLRKTFPKARIIYKIGNHEERYERYMRVKAPELLGLNEFKIESLLHLDKHGIELVSEMRPIRLGELNILHGHEYKFAISNPVNPARGLFLRTKAYALCGHFHQSSYHTDKTVEQKVIATWSTGCLCDLHPDYMPMNNWCHGFAFVEVGNDGKFNMQNKVIRNGAIY